MQKQNIEINALDADSFKQIWLREAGPQFGIMLDVTPVELSLSGLPKAA